MRGTSDSTVPALFLFLYTEPVLGLLATVQLCCYEWIQKLGRLDEGFRYAVYHLGAFPETFTPFIYSFNVPLLFVISGYLYKRSDTFTTFLKKNCISLIIPYLLLCLIKDFSHIIKY